MCRLYAFRATEDTKVECTLVHAQNALISQSKQDMSGRSHGHGWGVAAYDGQSPIVERRAWAAYHGEHFARAAARVYSTCVIAHVRRATVGAAKLINTHPFSDGQFVMAHNGTVPDFERIKPRLLDAMSARQRAAIQGETDSEHLFGYLRSLLQGAESLTLADALRKAVTDVLGWVGQATGAGAGSDTSLGLNLIISDGAQIAGTRVGRTLYSATRTGIYDCEICGFPHIHHNPNREYQAVVIASEPITNEHWTALPEHSVWKINDQAQLTVQPL